MKISGKGNEINELQISHAGTKLNFNRICRNRIDAFDTLIIPKVASIEFDDVHEVDEMIQMLCEFRKQLIGNMGLWGRMNGKK